MILLSITFMKYDKDANGIGGNILKNKRKIFNFHKLY